MNEILKELTQNNQNPNYNPINKTLTIDNYIGWRMYSAIQSMNRKLLVKQKPIEI